MTDAKALAEHLRELAGEARKAHFAGIAVSIGTLEDAADALTQSAIREAALVEALKSLSDMYTHAWDLVDGGLIMLPPSMERFERAHAKADETLKNISDSAARIGAIIDTAERVYRKYGADSDWTEWRDLGEALSALTQTKETTDGR